MRQVILDTETTGLEPVEEHRIIEIGCVELVNRRLTGRHFREYLNPGRPIDEGAIAVHGITDEDLADKPAFAEVLADFLAFVDGAEVVIHNAPFDVGFINHEMKLAGHEPPDLGEYCRILDTLRLARDLHPGQRNTLDALCRRYEIDNSQRTLHGALLDAEILADVYLAMTGGQTALGLDGRGDSEAGGQPAAPARIERDGLVLPVVRASEDERARHAELVEALGEDALWRHVGAAPSRRDA